MADISRIKLPSGNYYDIKDAVARQMIAGGISFVIAWNGSSTPVVANIPAGVVVKYNGTNYTGTLAASADTVGKFYLVKSTTQVETLDVYDEYATMRPTLNTYAWEKIGDTSIDLSSLKALAYKDNVTLYKGGGDNVLGEATTFTAGASNVSFATHTTKKAIGSSATFTVTQPTISVTPTTTNIKATASGAAVEADGTDTFVKSYPGATSKLVTTTVPNVTSAGSASTWGFAMGSGDDAETLVISGANGSAPTLGTAITAATGALNASGGGASVMTGLGTADTASALTGVKVTTQPTIALATGATAGTGVISVATGIDSASASGGAVAFNSKDEVTAITGLGAATAAAQTITVGNNDKVKVAKYDDIIAGDGMVVSGTTPLIAYVKRDNFGGSSGTVTVNGNTIGTTWTSSTFSDSITIEVTGMSYFAMASGETQTDAQDHLDTESLACEIQNNSVYQNYMNCTIDFVDGNKFRITIPVSRMNHPYGPCFIIQKR